MISRKRLIKSFLEMYNSIMFKKIGIIYKETLSFDADISAYIDTILSHSKELYFHESALDAPKDFPKISKDELGNQSDLIIVFGGDGTMLSTARDFIGYDIPIMGVNFGQVGFLTDSSENNFKQSIDDVFNNNFKLEERSFVKAEFGDNEIFGLNEIVLHSGSYAQMMRFSVTVDDQLIFEERADGLIISTPTGSTAYSLSAGGSIIYPNLKVWSIIPMLPHNLSSRPFIISSDRKVEIQVTSGPDKNAYISADGQTELPISYGTKVNISEKSDVLKLVHPSNYNFFEACRDKLGWALDVTKR